MVVLASSICTRGGKAILSRQFKEISKDRITALLASFPSLLSDSGSQNTTVEDENVRYVYQPLEELYIVLITNKSSNILQDIDTLHLFSETVTSMLRTVDEKEIFENAFEILSAFDEIISLGYKENLTLSQIQTFLEMDSHEEKIQEIIERNKELEATEERKRRAKEIQRKELARRNMEQFPSSQNMGYDSYNSTPQFTTPPQQEYNSTPEPSGAPLARNVLPKNRGLKLGKKSNKSDSYSNLLSENNSSSTPTIFNQSSQRIATPHVTSQPVPSAQISNKIPNNGILIIVNEKISAEITRDGSVISSEVKGDLQLRINDSELAHSKLLLDVSGASEGIIYKTHPNVDRNLFNNSSIIGLKDSTKPFPSNDNSLGVLRWRGVGKSDDTKFLPLTISCWLSPGENSFVDATIEYELSENVKDTLSNVTILIPVPTHDVHLRNDSDIPFSVSEDGVLFTIESIMPENPQGSFEFSIASNDDDALFPMELNFEIHDGLTRLGQVEVRDVVTNNEAEESLPFDLKSTLATEGYYIV